MMHPASMTINYQSLHHQREFTLKYAPKLSSHGNYRLILFVVTQTNLNMKCIQASMLPTSSYILQFVISYPKLQFKEFFHTSNVQIRNKGCPFQSYNQMGRLGLKDTKEEICDILQMVISPVFAPSSCSCRCSLLHKGSLYVLQVMSPPHKV